MTLFYIFFKPLKQLTIKLLNQASSQAVSLYLKNLSTFLFLQQKTRKQWCVKISKNAQFTMASCKVKTLPPRFTGKTIAKLAKQAG
jgi:hypothetical protein